MVDSEAADTRPSACRNSGSWSGEKLDYFLVGVPAQLAGAILSRCSADITGMRIWIIALHYQDMREKFIYGNTVQLQVSVAQEYQPFFVFCFGSTRCF